MAEEWRQIAGYDGRYEVSDCGRVRVLYNGKGGRRHVFDVPRQLALQPVGKRGEYRHVGLYKGGVDKTFLVHILVMDAFIGPKPAGTERAHKNGKGWDNRVSNLAYKTPKENHADKRIHGTLPMGEKHPMAILTVKKVLAVRAATGSQRKIASDFGISQPHVSAIRSRKVWPHV